MDELDEAGRDGRKNEDGGRNAAARRRLVRICLYCGESSPLSAPTCIHCDKPHDLHAPELLVAAPPWGMRALVGIVAAAVVVGFFNLGWGLMVGILGTLSLGPIFRRENTYLLRMTAAQLAVARGPREAHAFLRRCLSKLGRADETLQADAKHYEKEAAAMEERLQTVVKRALEAARGVAEERPADLGEQEENTKAGDDEAETSVPTLYREAEAEEDPVPTNAEIQAVLETKAGECLSVAEEPKPLPPVMSKPTLWAFAAALSSFIPGLGLLSGPAALLLLFGSRPSVGTERAGGSGAVGGGLVWERAARKLAAWSAVAGCGLHALYFAAVFTTGVPVRVNPPPTAAGGGTGKWLYIGAALAALILSVSLHECFHAAAGFIAGDPTARERGRVSLNPLRHLDWVGSFILPLALAAVGSPAILGYAKPVPYDERRVRRKLGVTGITLAGPFANLFLIGVALSLLIVFRPAAAAFGFVPDLFLADWPNPNGVAYAGSCAPPLALGAFFLLLVALVNIILFIFNLLPVPPLDGFNALLYLLPESLGRRLKPLQGWGWLPLLLLFATPVEEYLLIPLYYSWAAARLLVVYAGGL